MADCITKTHKAWKKNPPSTALMSELKKPKILPIGVTSWYRFYGALMSLSRIPVKYDFWKSLMIPPAKKSTKFHKPQSNMTRKKSQGSLIHNNSRWSSCERAEYSAQ